MAKVIFARSPFIVEIKVATQTSTRLELDILNAAGVLQNTYSFSKSIPSTIDYGTYYNISNFVLEYLSSVKPNYTTSTESTTLYCSATVRRYRTISAVEALIDTTTYLCVNGFTEYTNGMNSYLDVDAIPLTSDILLSASDKTIYSYNPITQIINYSPFIDTFYTVDNAIIKVDSILININSLNPSKVLTALGSYVDVFLQKSGVNTYSIKYTDGIATNTIDITPANTNPITTKVFLQSPYWNSTFPYTVGLYRGSTLLWSRTIDADIEYKYTPSLCSFISKSGGWENVYFMKAKETSTTMENTTYNLIKGYNYDAYEAQKKSFNTNGNDFIKLNTGWVNESMNFILKDLMFSENILLDNKPVLIKNKAITYKNVLKDKLINYEIEFEYAYDYINNIV